MSTPKALRIHRAGRHIETVDGEPFFYLADTCWEIFHRLTREEIVTLLDKRAAQGFTAIQGVILAEFDGLNVPNREGHLPLADRDPRKPIEAYFDLVDFAVAEAGKRGLYMVLLPTWGDKWNIAWGGGPEVFSPESGHWYCKWLSDRYPGPGVIWMLGGDRPVEEKHKPILRAMAEGIRQGASGKNLICHHPVGGTGSSQPWPDEPWLDFHAWQSGHTGWDAPNQDLIRSDWERTPVKPVLDSEPCYEDHPVMADGWQSHIGWFMAWEVRKAAYRPVLSGACGHTYGCHDVWQMRNDAVSPPINRSRMQWHDAIDLDGAWQMRHVKALAEAFPGFVRRPAPELVEQPGAGKAEEKIAAASLDGSAMAVYLPLGGTVELNLDAAGALKGRPAVWFDPRTGAAFPAGPLQASMAAPSAGPRNDWVLACGLALG